MELTDQNRTTFAATGLLNLERQLPKSRTEPAKQYLMGELERLGIREGGKWHTKKFDGVSPFQVANVIAQKLRHHPSLDQVIPPEMVTSIGQLAGAKVKAAQTNAQILITPPQKEKWEVPALGWHVDVAIPAKDIVPGIQVFVLLGDIAKQGGGTMVIPGSHKNRDLIPNPNTVMEMCGNAGDIYLMDMRIRHAPSINATKHARIMLTARYLIANIL